MIRSLFRIPTIELFRIPTIELFYIYAMGACVLTSTRVLLMCKLPNNGLLSSPADDLHHSLHLRTGEIDATLAKAPEDRRVADLDFGTWSAAPLHPT